MIFSGTQELGQWLVQILLDADDGDRGHQLRCEQGHRLEFMGFRTRTITGRQGPIQVCRAYCYCRECKAGVAFRDHELGIADSTMTPWVRRLLDQVGADKPFEKASVDLYALSGIEMSRKRVERWAKVDGDLILEHYQEEREVVDGDRVVSLSASTESAAQFEGKTAVIEVDGTGIPVLRREVEGRKGKGADGVARTREAKIGCVFVQGEGGKGKPERDPDTSSYVGTMRAADEFASFIRKEAQRRGVEQADRVVLMGDGGTWIWKTVAPLFPEAIEIVDFWHAREHLSELAKLAITDRKQRQRWIRGREIDLLRGRVDTVIVRLEELARRRPHFAEETEKEIGYFSGNRDRMRYRQYRRMGLFIGTGVIEAACRQVHQRLKISGMHWSVQGAAAILGLRCHRLSQPARPIPAHRRQFLTPQLQLAA